MVCYHQNFDKFKIINSHVYREFRTQTGESLFQFLVPRNDRKLVLELLHDSSMSGHLGREKNIEKVQKRFYWPRSYKEIKDHVKECDECQKSKSETENIQPLNSIRVSEPFELITMDIIGPILPVSRKKNKYILVIIDHFTKWVELQPMMCQSAVEVARLVFEYICRHSCPKRLLTDQGKCFEAELFKKLMMLLDVVKSRTTPYYPQCDGQTERFNRTLESMLR